MNDGKESGSPPILLAGNLHRIDGLRHGFTTRLNRSGTLSGERLMKRLGLPGCRPIHMHQVHGNRVIPITDPEAAAVSGPADGAVTSLPRTVLTVRTADCVALLAADPERRVIGAAHAGWRGTSLSIPAGLIRVMIETRGCRPRDIRVGVGPAIGPCCYTVGEDVRRTFRRRGRETNGAVFRTGPDGRLRLDLRAAVVLQLRAAGIAPDRIDTIDLCTACRPDLFPSYRRDGPGPERLHAFIAWSDRSH